MARMPTSTPASGDPHAVNPFAGEPPGMLFGLPMAMARVAGLIGESVGNDRAQVRMRFQPEQANSRGEVHGGSLATLLDCTLASAARAHDPAAYGVATIDLTLHFLSVARGDVIASAHCERRGRSISFARGEVRAEDGTLVALATGTFKLIAREAHSHRRGS